MTEYLILTQAASNGPWTEYDKIRASSADTAIRRAIDAYVTPVPDQDDNVELPKMWVAVPTRSWDPAEPQMERKLQLRLLRKTKEKAKA